ncbi:MAG: hypothetical protein SOR11_04795 [Fusobacterium sp.]|uniref:hypothetical protein n=1 Tax=Fusobacterium sp. TaxID=68766 RepID=UPI002A74B85D|nr:hypothetical protein [Fusobacterium sp.]MDY3059301.1 hypothetical protein [Fusobacterium sp.]
MALDLVVKKRGDRMTIGYGAYFNMRIEILNTIQFGLGDKFKKESIHEKFYSDEVFNTVKKLKLDNFIFHSDCDGYLTYREVKKTLEVLEKYNFSSNEWSKEINQFINLLKKARDKKSYIYYC